MNIEEELYKDISLDIIPQKTSLAEAWNQLQLMVAKVVKVLDFIGKDLTGLQKKEIALKFINTFYDSAFSIIGIPLVPNFLEPIIHRYIKQILMTMVSSSIDATVTIFKQVGIIKKQETANG